MFTIGHAQKYASRPTCLAYSSVILTRVSGPGGIARVQLWRRRQRRLGCCRCCRSGCGHQADKKGCAGCLHRHLPLLPPSEAISRASARRISAPSRARCGSLRCTSSDRTADFLDIGKHPALVEECLGRRVETEHQLELPRRIGRNPVRIPCPPVPSGRSRCRPSRRRSSAARESATSGSRAACS